MLWTCALLRCSLWWARGLAVEWRCFLAAIVSLAALLALHVSVILIPIATGRAAMQLTGAPSRGHDVYALLAGTYVMYGARRAWRWISTTLENHGVFRILKMLLRYTKLMIQVRK